MAAEKVHSDSSRNPERIFDSCPHGMPYRYPELCDECLMEERDDEEQKP